MDSSIASVSLPWLPGRCRGCCGPRELGPEPDRCPILGDRLLQLPLVLQGEAQVVVGFGVIGLEPDRCQEFGDRLLQLALVLKGGTKVVVGAGVIRPEPDAVRNSAIA